MTAKVAATESATAATAASIVAIHGISHHATAIAAIHRRVAAVATI
jgi:hypothetical protein